MTDLPHLYLVERTDTADYDEHGAVLVRAPSEQDALNYLLTARSCDVLHDMPAEPPWTERHYEGFAADGSNARVTLIGTAAEDGPTGEIISHFWHG